MASSPFSSAMEEKRYDVFLSFRGEDTRDRFATYLYQAFRQKQILTFMDHRLNRGHEIAPTLLKTIRESAISVVIFSENYATSTWCLDELVHILECKERNGQIVIPIFYGIDPSFVRKRSYEDAFGKLEERFKHRMEKVLRWRAALTQAADICGWHSKNLRPENQLIEQIVEDVLLKLPKYSLWNIEHCKGRLFAIQERMKEIENLLDIECSKDVRIIGIWGMGGIGKTTLASAVFQKFSYSRFEGRSFVSNVRQQYENFGPDYLRKELLTQLFNDEDALISMDTPFVGSPFIQDRLRRKKVLIVFDDVDSSVQLETLVEGYHQLAPGSRIIVTSRNKQVLVKVADGVYKVEGLNEIDSLKLFQWHAFGRNSYPTEYYETLSKRVASYADGNPLAVKVLGSFLHSKSEEEWESALENLKRVPNDDILKVLRISYEGLNGEKTKNIFLDIACFFDTPFIREYAESILDNGDSSAKIGISDLIDKSLFEICHEENYLRMHDMIRQMGWSVVSDEHKEPGNRSRLCNTNDVCHVLEKNTGTASIQGILLNISEIKRDVKMNPAAFSKMYNLRFIKIYCDNIDSNKFKLYLPRGFDSFLHDELRYFQWDFYPFESLPSDFIPENLVELILRHSHLKQLESHVVKSLSKLKKMDLSNSKLLTRIADLSPASSLESLNLEGCTSLIHVLSSIQNLPKLTDLNLSGCNKLRELAEISWRRGNMDIVKNLSNNICHLNFALLSSSIKGLINNFPLYSSSSNISLKFPMNLTSLNLSETRIEEFPSSVCCLPHLRSLDLEYCEKLKSLSTSIVKLKSLQDLDLYGCSNLEEFPELLEPMEHLESITLGETAIKRLPESIENLIGLTSLNVDRGREIEYLPRNLCKLSRLTHLYLTECSKLQTLHPCPRGLKYLYVRYCESLKLIEELPPNLIKFYASHCTLLETISSRTNESYLMVEEGLRLENCSKLDQNTQNFVVNKSKRMCCRPNFNICYPGDEIPKEFRYRSKGSSMKIKLPKECWLGVAFCIVFDRMKADANTDIDISYEIDDGHGCKRGKMGLCVGTYVGLEAVISLDHVFVFSIDEIFTRSSDVTFKVWPSFSVTGNDYCDYCKSPVDLGSDYCNIKKWGIRLQYKKNSTAYFQD